MIKRLLFPYGSAKFVDVRKEMMTREVSARKMTAADYERLYYALQRKKARIYDGRPVQSKEGSINEG